MFWIEMDVIFNASPLDVSPRLVVDDHAELGSADAAQFRDDGLR
jgi:hypothetical protein